jgi:hypothetical protein
MAAGNKEGAHYPGHQCQINQKIQILVAHTYHSQTKN